MHINVCLLFEWMDMITSGFFAFHFICLELRSFRENEPFFKPELVFVVVVVRVTGAKWPFFLFSACCIGVRPQSMRSHCGWLCFFLLGWCKEYTASYGGAECGEWRCIKEENDSLPYCIIHCFCFFLFLRLLLVWALNSETMWLCTGFFGERMHSTQVYYVPANNHLTYSTTKRSKRSKLMVNIIIKLISCMNIWLTDDIIITNVGRNLVLFVFESLTRIEHCQHVCQCGFLLEFWSKKAKMKIIN